MVCGGNRSPHAWVLCLIIVTGLGSLFGRGACINGLLREPTTAIGELERVRRVGEVLLDVVRKGVPALGHAARGTAPWTTLVVSLKGERRTVAVVVRVVDVAASREGSWRCIAKPTLDALPLCRNESAEQERAPMALTICCGG